MDYAPIQMPTKPCRHCGDPTTFQGTKLCNGCWEAERQLQFANNRGKINIIVAALESSPVAARRDILAEVVKRSIGTP